MIIKYYQSLVLLSPDAHRLGAHGPRPLLAFAARRVLLLNAMIAMKDCGPACCPVIDCGPACCPIVDGGPAAPPLLTNAEQPPPLPLSLQLTTSKRTSAPAAQTERAWASIPRPADRRAQPPPWLRAHAHLPLVQRQVHLEHGLPAVVGARPRLLADGHSGRRRGEAARQLLLDQRALLWEWVGQV